MTYYVLGIPVEELNVYETVHRDEITDEIKRLVNKYVSLGLNMMRLIISPPKSKDCKFELNYKINSLYIPETNKIFQIQLVHIN